MIRIVLFDAHRDRKTACGAPGRERMFMITKVEKAGYKVEKYHHWYFKPDFKYPNLFRVWVDFETTEEAVEFKLKFL